MDLEARIETLLNELDAATTEAEVALLERKLKVLRLLQ